MELKTTVMLENKRKYFPLSLTAFILIADQISKALIVRFIPRYPLSPGHQVLGDFFRIIHTRNLGAAFSIGRSLPGTIRYAVFSILPLIALGIIFIYYVRGKDLLGIHRWALAGIIGGGLGNIIDRLFRPEGVVDFLDFKFFGIFGLERWPTFNLADSSVVIFGILLAVSLTFGEGEKTG